MPASNTNRLPVVFALRVTVAHPPQLLPSEPILADPLIVTLTYFRHEGGALLAGLPCGGHVFFLQFQEAEVRTRSPYYYYSTPMVSWIWTQYVAWCNARASGRTLRRSAACSTPHSNTQRRFATGVRPLRSSCGAPAMAALHDPGSQLRLPPLSRTCSMRTSCHTCPNRGPSSGSWLTSLVSF